MSFAYTCPGFSAFGVGFPDSIHSLMVPRPVASPTGSAFSRDTFMPLYWAGLCEAVIWTEALNPYRAVPKYTIGVVDRPMS